MAMKDRNKRPAEKTLPGFLEQVKSMAGALWNFPAPPRSVAGADPLDQLPHARDEAAGIERIAGEA
ncbi:MAG: hypothetical protein WEC00_02210, partial [Dongiaceae bacterium]